MTVRFLTILSFPKTTNPPNTPTAISFINKVQDRRGQSARFCTLVNSIRMPARRNQRRSPAQSEGHPALDTSTLDWLLFTIIALSLARATSSLYVDKVHCLMEPTHQVAQASEELLLIESIPDYSSLFITVKNKIRRTVAMFDYGFDHEKELQEVVKTTTQPSEKYIAAKRNMTAEQCDIFCTTLNCSILSIEEYAQIARKENQLPPTYAWLAEAIAISDEWGNSFLTFTVNGETVSLAFKR